MRYSLVSCYDMELQIPHLSWDSYERNALSFVWCDLRKLGAKWLVKVLQSIYWNTGGRVRVDCTFSDDFMVGSVKILSGVNVKSFAIYHSTGSIV